MLSLSISLPIITLPDLPGTQHECQWRLSVLCSQLRLNAATNLMQMDRMQFYVNAYLFVLSAISIETTLTEKTHSEGKKCGGDLKSHAGA